MRQASSVEHVEALPRRYADVNAVAGGLLRDLALVQTSQEKMFGYKRAPSSVLALEQPLTDLLQDDHTLRKIPGIGPSSSRVILEVLDTGESDTVEQAVADSGRIKEIQERRVLRANF